MVSNHFTVYPSRQKKVVGNTNKPRRRRVYAADGDFDLDMNDADNADNAFADQVDDMADNIEDIQDSIDDVKEDDIDIDIENNITGHYIAECEKCKGIFISATVKSDQSVSSVSGVCPLCQEESEQYLKWYIVPNDEDEDEDEEMESTTPSANAPSESNVPSGNL